MQTLPTEYARVSQSALWKIQEDFYRHLGTLAWSGPTPYFITNSAVTAEVYADLILAYLRDQQARLERSAPVYVLEVGAGIGRLAFHMLRELDRKLAAFPETSELRVCLILADFTEATAGFWAAHPAFQSYLAEGRLDFAVFYPETETRLRLRHSGRELGAADLANPLIILANYFFDSIRHDEFRVQGGQLQECRLKLTLKEETGFSSQDRIDIRDVNVERDYAEVASAGYYPQAAWNECLENYRAQVSGEGAFTFPVAALTCLDNLRALSRSDYLLISSDRGYTVFEDMLTYPIHTFDIHNGCFSHFVNYAALGWHVLRRGGRYLYTRHKALNSLHTVVYQEGPGSLPGWNLNYVFRERLELGSAINVARELFGLAKDDPEPSGLCLQAFVRLNAFDPQAVTSCARALGSFAKKLHYSEALDLVAALEEAYAREYHFEGAPHLTFWLAHIYYELGLYPRALELVEETIRRTGEDELILCVKGNCLEWLGRHPEAIECYRNALECNPDYAAARHFLEDVQRRLGSGS